ncbi:MAG: hypothetical protein K0R45_1446 [Pseudomonas sp.]|nr:hypothetical protein [Pseudomonas sp.]
MNQIWSPFDPDTLFTPSSATLEMPAVLQLPAHGERADALHPSVRFALSPFQNTIGEERLPLVADDPLQRVEPDPDVERRLRSLRKSPGFGLLAGSVLLLKACQLDMDLPPRRRHYVRERLADGLKQQFGASLDPDELHITFTTETGPEVNDEEAEHHTRRLSLTDLALARCNPAHFKGFSESVITEAPLSVDHPSLQAHAVLRLIAQASWTDDYETALDAFWKRQRKTYRALCKLSFLDGLSRQLTRKRISHEGYLLSLNALGLREFPGAVAALEQSGRGDKTEVWGLLLGDECVPGIFQVRSRNTSHCFIHVVGAERRSTEYISDDPAEMTRRLLQAMNNSGWHRQMLNMLEFAHGSGLVVRASLIEGDVFTALTRAQESVTRKLLPDEQFDRLDLLKPLARALALASAVEWWPSRFPVLDRLPTPSGTAAQLMKDFLHTRCGLSLDPDQVFIAYRRGETATPLGNPRFPATDVHVPDETPISLSQALMIHYRVQRPSGYVDHGGRTVVYLDRSRIGTWSESQALPIDPHVIEQHIRQVDFLSTMSARITEFWDLQRDAIERSFTAIFISQALVSLKQGRLTRGGFDLVIRALDGPETVRWSALGFHVQSSAISSLTPVYPGLLILEQPGGPDVLYQAGHAQAFREFHDADGLHHYLRRSAADQGWRESVAHYVARSHHERLEYLLRLWGGILPPHAPASLLRPWTDVLYNHDTRKALQHTLIKRSLDSSPFGFLRQTLRQNALEDAQDMIVTAAEVSLRYWTSRLHQLQLLLVPMSVLLTPAFLASLATEIGITSLNIASARLPGSRHDEQKQALLSALSLGLLRLGPQTPRLARSLGRILKSGGEATRAGSVAALEVRVLSSLFHRSMSARQTRLAKFFHTDAMLKRWTIPSHPRFGTLSVHAWKLGRRFLLWTSERGQARTLVVTTHGGYLPWSSTVKIPHGTEIRTYAPHGYALVDPLLHRIVNRTAQPFAISNAAGNMLVQRPATLAPLVSTDRLMAGTSLPGRLKNYTLSKFQSPRGETYEDIGHIVRNSNVSPLHGQLPAIPMDVLTVRNRFGMPSPMLADLFDTLYAHGIHYDRILLVHCRCAALAALFRRAPAYHAPTLKPSIAKMTDLAGQLVDTTSNDFTHRS